jgi:hypothetical protein
MSIRFNKKALKNYSTCMKIFENNPVSVHIFRLHDWLPSRKGYKQKIIFKNVL